VTTSASSAPDLSKFIADLLLVLKKLSSAEHELVIPVIQYLAAVQARNHLPPSGLQKFVDMYLKLGEHDAGERRYIICQRMGFERSTYYRWLAEAQEAGRIPK
jgi:hypothetical protein